MHKIFKNVKTDSIKPYERNPRKNDRAISEVVKSIEQVGYRTPIIVDENNVVLTGHTRLEAIKRLGWERIPFIVQFDDLSDEKKNEYRIRDNKTSEFAEWDYDILYEDFSVDDLISFGFDIDEDNEKEYTQTVNIPIYEPKEKEKPALEKLYNIEKYDSLVEEIIKKTNEGPERDFLIAAASRFIQFTYSQIAEYYCHSDKKTQALFERLALIIIDKEQAIELGFLEMTKKISKQLKHDR